MHVISLLRVHFCSFFCQEHTCTNFSDIQGFPTVPRWLNVHAYWCFCFLYMLCFVYCCWLFVFFFLVLALSIWFQLMNLNVPLLSFPCNSFDRTPGLLYLYTKKISTRQSIVLDGINSHTWILLHCFYQDLRSNNPLKCPFSSGFFNHKYSTTKPYHLYFTL